MGRPQLFVPLGHTWGVDHVHGAGYVRTTHVKSADRGLSGTKVTGSIEAELRPSDLQALERKVALKRRDGGVERVFLVLADTRYDPSLAPPGRR